MSGDYSRIGYDPRQNYSVVLLEQGRPLTDRDWNDFALAAARRDQAGMLDALGQVYMSLTTPDAFLITADAERGLLIGRGRLYLDGLLVENHGSGATKWDGGLATEYGGDPTPYSQQPYLHKIEPLPATGGPYVVYLDVWQREVTQFTDPGLLEKALGIDTTTRLQTVWQVKLVDLGVGDCQTALDENADWIDLAAPSAGRLSIGPAAVANNTITPLAPPIGGYRGLENQLYRIEIHDGGELGAATFKWSRENASVEARVTRIIDDTHIVVESIGKDEVLRFSDGDWIEVTDDGLELSGAPGQMLKIRVEGGIDESSRTIALEKALTLDLFPTDTQGQPLPQRHMRIRRWDQKGKILDRDGNLLVDLSASNSTGTIPAGNVSVHLEEGIVATFSMAPGSPRASFRPGDHWVFAARATDASVEPLEKAAPRGIHHHYAKLAIYTPGSRIQDCRPKSTSDVEGRLSALELAVPPINDHLTSIDTKIATINTTLQSTGQMVTSLDGKLTTLESGLRSTRTDLSNLTNKVSTIDTTLQSTLTDISALRSQLTNIDQRLQTAEGKMSDIDQRLKSLERDFPTVKKGALAPELEPIRPTDAPIPFNPNSGPVRTEVRVAGRNFKAGTVTIRLKDVASSSQFSTTAFDITEFELRFKIPDEIPANTKLQVTVDNTHAATTAAQTFLVVGGG